MPAGIEISPFFGKDATFAPELIISIISSINIITYLTKIIKYWNKTIK